MQTLTSFGVELSNFTLIIIAFKLDQSHALKTVCVVFFIKMIARVFITPIVSKINSDTFREIATIIAFLCSALAFSLVNVTKVWHIYALAIVLQVSFSLSFSFLDSALGNMSSDKNNFWLVKILMGNGRHFEIFYIFIMMYIFLLTIGLPALFDVAAIIFFTLATFIACLHLEKTVSPQNASSQIQKNLFYTFLFNPWFRGVLAINFIASLATAAVTINSFTLVQGVYGLSYVETINSLLIFASGQVFSRLMLNRIYAVLSKRDVVFLGGSLLVAGLLIAVKIHSFSSMLILWFTLGVGIELSCTPIVKLLQKPIDSKTRTRLLSAQYTTSTLCAVITYPIVSWSEVYIGTQPSFLVFGSLASIAIIIGVRYWPHNEDSSNFSLK
ncbi:MULTISPECIES: hypothetical protein [Chromobacterium]|uniref:hypothetical protein n=1 Tax=Chromobacterium TaxID=535 RepID=UPI001F2E1A97|nr:MULTISPECIES: hypothetical protein [Chromobacterium]MCS3802687.1 Na+/melibiose symporter-like transporter [Chromobacterium alkanivorans]MCS3817013.1 Na+/melibiose symporter-like transporter [Chromobacterium alkanivorans]MCS3872053.1 Na+/melibiose symporter-like transporter [Chromobacterium alkanivorans]UJB33616.1 hypothetical protein HQN78_22635 [Chromobacterium sp. Beijing]